MENSRTLALPVALCMICHFCTATAHVLLLSYYQFNAMNYWANMIIPIGAFMLGLAASAMFVAACRFADYPATPAIRRIMMLVAVIMFPLVYLAEYGFAHTGDVYARNVITFAEYATLKLEHAQFSMRAHRDSSVNLGSIGYVMALAEWAAYVGGAFFGYRILARFPFCKPCGRFYARLAKRNILFRDEADFVRFYTELPEDKVTRMAMAKSYVSGFKSIVTRKKGSWQFAFSHSQCPVCKLENVRENVTVMGNRQTHEIAELRSEYSMPRGAARTADPAGGSSSGPSRRAQFGRRSV